MTATLTYSGHPAAALTKAIRARPGIVLPALLTIVFLVLGTVGHDPWKADEPYCMGIVHNMLQAGDWLVPHVGPDPFLEKPPLVFWTAALSARMLTGTLPFVDAARLVIVVWMMITASALGWAATLMFGEPRRWPAVMLLFGTIGMWQHGHKLIPDVGQLTGATVALAALVAFAAGRISARTSGLLAGTGVGVAFLSKGLLIPGVFGVLAAMLPLCAREFRTRTWVQLLGWATVAALPWLIIWPALLYQRSPALFLNWLWDNNFDRFLGIDHHGEEHPSRTSDLARLLALSFPAGAIAIVALWQGFRRRHNPRDAARAAKVVVAIYALVLVFTLEVSASLREVYFLPVYPALALLAAGLDWPRRMAPRMVTGAILLFGVLGALVVATWALLMLGHADWLPAFVGRWLPLDYVLPLDGGWVLVALGLYATWLWAVRSRLALGPIGIWFAGATLVWGLANSLLLPWLDTTKTYRNTFKELSRVLAPEEQCVTTIGFGESERAMLQYFTGRMPYERNGPVENLDCGVAVLMLKDGKSERGIVQPTWTRFWDGSRSGEEDRRFVAYRQGRG